MNLNKKIYTCIIGLFLVGTAMAGNPDRIGQSGGNQLVMNPWAQSAGWGWSGVSGMRGLEAIYMNVGGLAYTQNTEMIFSNTNWLVGTDVKINSFGISQSLSGEGVIGIAIMTTDVGEIDITTVSQPEGGVGTFSPRLNNISLAYAKRFTESISGGIVVKVHSESISNVKTQGVAIDAGIQYTETINKKDKLKKNDVKFGISLKNVGPDPNFSGDGLSFKADLPENGQAQTFNQRSASYGLPTLISIGASYDMRLDKTKETFIHRLTPAFTFTSNAYARNQFTIGFEYGYKDVLMLRTGYGLEKDGLDYDTRTNAYTGLSAGFTYQLPLNKEKGSKFGLDYAFQQSNPFSGTHSIGVRIKL
jgi:hypothetical protein